MNNKTINYQAHRAASADVCNDISICKRMLISESKLLRSFINRLGFTTFETVEGVSGDSSCEYGINRTLWKEAYINKLSHKDLIDSLSEAIDFTIKTNK